MLMDVSVISIALFQTTQPESVQALLSDKWRFFAKTSGDSQDAHGRTRDSTRANIFRKYLRENETFCETVLPCLYGVFDSKKKSKISQHCGAALQSGGDAKRGASAWLCIILYVPQYHSEPSNLIHTSLHNFRNTRQMLCEKVNVTTYNHQFSKKLCL